MSLADKLNYTIAAKLDVQQACIYQGVDLPDNAPFGDYGKYIRLLSGDGGSVSWDGTFTFLGKTYNRPTRDKPYVSFYRQNELGIAWEIEYDIYSPNKSKQLFS